MGIVKFFSPSGTTPPPTYLNYVGTLSGSFANTGPIDGSGGEIYIPLNNFSIADTPTNDKNVTQINLSASGQDVDFFFYGVKIAVGNIGGSGGDANPYAFRVNIYINGVLETSEVVTLTDFGTISIVLPSPVAVTSDFSIGVLTDCTSFEIVSANTLFYCTGNIIPPPACEYFNLVSASNGGSQLICISPVVGLAYGTPLIYQAVNWTGGLSGNRVPRIRNWRDLDSDSTATLIQGQIYYVEVTLSTPLPVISGNQKDMGLFFGYDINDRSFTFPVTVDGSLTTPQGFLLEWNPNSVADPLFMFIGEAMGSPNQYNGQITFRVGTSYCP
jgi:hypothetical protein